MTRTPVALALLAMLLVHLGCDGMTETETLKAGVEAQRAARDAADEKAAAERRAKNAAVLEAMKKEGERLDREAAAQEKPAPQKP